MLKNSTSPPDVLRKILVKPNMRLLILVSKLIKKLRLDWSRKRLHKSLPNQWLFFAYWSYAEWRSDFGQTSNYQRSFGSLPHNAEKKIIGIILHVIRDIIFC